MACTWFALLATVCLFLVSGHLVRGKGVPENASLVVDREATLQGRSKTVAANQTEIAHVAVLRTHSGVYSGAQATLNVYGLPAIKKGQASSMQVWVMNGVDNHESFNSIQAGWHVNPDLYGDSDTHFFVQWTADKDYKTGCFNSHCEGFVHDPTSQLVPGYRLQPLSQYNGEQRYITLRISKDHAFGVWRLHSGPGGNQSVGYWPESLFTSLAKNATHIQMGGSAGFIKGGISPPMGSGHVVTESEGKAASLKYPILIDENGLLRAPRVDTYSYYFDREDCYKLGGDVLTGTVYVGGPGGCKD